MRQTRFRLSIEELAFAMGILGGANVASGFLIATLGEKSQPELEGRLYAAGHSLMARGCLELEGETKQLDKTLSDMVSLLLENKFSIRCSRSAGGVEQTLNYFFRDKIIIEHRSFQEVVCQLGIISGTQALLELSKRFYSLPQKAPTGNQIEAAGIVPASLLERARVGISDVPQNQINLLFQEAGISVDHAKNLADDLYNPEYRGSVIRIEKENGQFVSNQGFLLLKGMQRFWILEILSQDPTMARVFPGTDQRYNELFRALLK